MKFICSQPVLNKALNTVQKAITNRTTIPILKGILIETTENNTIKLTATDSEICIEKEFECKVEKPGSLVVSARLFTEMIRKLPADDVIIENSDGIINIECKKYKSSVVALSSEEFPSINAVEENNKLNFNKEDFRNLIRKTSFAASTDEARGVLTGVLVKINEGLLTMAAIDGFRVAIASVKKDFGFNCQIVIAAKILNDINKILAEEEEEEFTFIIGEKNAVFIIGTTKITLRLLEGQFIDYEALLPKTFTTEITLNRSELISVMDRASLVAREGNINNLVKVSASKADNLITVSTRSDAGKIIEDMAADIEGNEIEIGFNSKYLIDVMKVIDDDAITIRMNSSVQPCMIKSVEDDGSEYMVLPVRI